MTTAATCPVTIHPPVPPRRHNRGEITYLARACGEPVVADGLCAEHLADRERLK